MVIKVEIGRELEERFRKLAMKKFGYSKGSIKKATESAIRKWTAETVAAESEPIKNKDNPVELIAGGLSHLKGKKTSVQLQHETKKLWGKTAENK